MFVLYAYAPLCAPPCANSAVPLVFTALIAERCRALRPRFCAAVCAWRDKLACEATESPSRCSAAEVALDRVLDGRPLCALRPFCVSRLACSRVCSEVLPFFGGASFTPARRAFDSPIAMACCGERAPCFPSRMWCISSRTNSPACTLGDFPSSASLRARSMVSCSGMTLAFDGP